jgi:hypothetical protein
MSLGILARLVTPPSGKIFGLSNGQTEGDSRDFVTLSSKISSAFTGRFSFSCSGISPVLAIS